MSLGMRIVFMGTPEFAVASLDAVIDAGHQVVAVITAPDKAVGRGQRIGESAVKTYAKEHGLTLLQPANLKDSEFQRELAALKAELQIVVAFRMLPEAVWAMPPGGTVNLHASLLPDYRGAAPINWAVINGDSETGLTTFFIEREIDTGKVLLQEKIPIPHDWSAGQLHDEMMIKGGALLVKTIETIESGTAKAMDQSHLMDSSAEVRQAPKIFKEDCRIDWDLPVARVYNHIRGLNPYPTAWTELVSPEGQVSSIKLFQCSKDAENIGGSPGSVIVNNQQWKVACSEGTLSINELQLAGKKRMSASDFLRGFELNNKWILR
ncbi:MAG: methionyl-tRNA formyltransferase [Flavobacteriales bacterium]|nr:methionyl-tRNA formyltransferase [Flavobacteriales bacterium]MBL4736110.1 methionyl-tRNA formyltransferase [Flavobacteriales bacterium]